MPPSCLINPGAPGLAPGREYVRGSVRLSRKIPFPSFIPLCFPQRALLSTELSFHGLESAFCLMPSSGKTEVFRQKWTDKEALTKESQMQRGPCSYVFWILPHSRGHFLAYVCVPAHSYTQTQHVHTHIHIPTHTCLMHMYKHIIYTCAQACAHTHNAPTQTHTQIYNI